MVRSYSTLAGMIITLIMMALMVPLPSPLLDSLICLNWVLSVALLVNLWSTPKDILLSEIPAWLMGLTIARLCINVATTRSILTVESGGGIVDQAGAYLLGDRWVVGLVFFIALVSIQYIVIARGVERIAQLTSRFTLEALPGAQQAISLDVERGRIHPEHGRQLRGALNQQSARAGAIEGVLKFIKGEQLASIILILLNGVGGVAIGTQHRGYSENHASLIYGQMTIGDALLAQVPALFCSLVATLFVTRLISAPSGLPASPIDMQEHTLRWGQSLMGAGSGLALMSLVPLWTTSSRLVIVFMSLFICIWALRLKKRRPQVDSLHHEHITLKLHPDLLNMIGGQSKLASHIDQHRKRSGIPKRILQVESDEQLLHQEVLLCRSGGETSRATIPSGRVFTLNPNIEGIQGEHPRWLTSGVWRDSKDTPPRLAEFTPLEWIVEWSLSHWRRDQRLTWHPSEVWGWLCRGDQALQLDALTKLPLITLTDLLRRLTSEGCVLNRPDDLLEGIARAMRDDSSDQSEPSRAERLHSMVRASLPLNALIRGQTVERLGVISIEIPFQEDSQSLEGLDRHEVIESLHGSLQRYGYHEGEIAFVVPQHWRSSLQELTQSAGMDLIILSTNELQTANRPQYLGLVTLTVL